MLTTTDKYDEYVEKLLVLQSDAAEIFEHTVVRGEAREDFIKDCLVKQFSHIQFLKGELTNGFKSSGEADLILCNSKTRVRRHGSKSLVNVSDCEFLFEVKTTATGKEFKDFNSKVLKIKTLDPNSNFRSGVFCYNLGITKKEILKRFGFKYDKDLNAYFYDQTITPEYPNIDFVLSIDDTVDYIKGSEDIRKFFILKDQQGIYQLYLEHPVSKYFFKMLECIC